MYKWQDWSVKRYSTKLLVHGHTDIQVQECATSIKHDSSIQLQECLTSKIVKWVLSNGFPILIEKNMFPVQQTLYRSKWSMTDIDQEISGHHHHFFIFERTPTWGSQIGSGGFHFPQLGFKHALSFLGLFILLWHHLS